MDPTGRHRLPPKDGRGGTLQQDRRRTSCRLASSSSLRTPPSVGKGPSRHRCMDMLFERWGGGIALSGFIQFWNRKTGEEGYTTRPLSRYADQVREWAYGLWAAAGRRADVLVWQASEAGLESGIGECLGGKAYARVRWHGLHRGGAGACWARRPDWADFKWCGRWHSTAVVVSSVVAHPL